MSRLTSMDETKAELAARYPGFQIWYVPRAGRGVTWCARPYPLLNEETPEDLAAAIERAAREFGLPG